MQPNRKIGRNSIFSWFLIWEEKFFFAYIKRNIQFTTILNPKFKKQSGTKFEIPNYNKFIEKKVKQTTFIEEKKLKKKLLCFNNNNNKTATSSAVVVRQFLLYNFILELYFFLWSFWTTVYVTQRIEIRRFEINRKYYKLDLKTKSKINLHTLTYIFQIKCKIFFK